MDIQLLGAILLRDAATSVSPGSGRARCLLALLASRPRTFVPDEVAIESIWDHAVPANPRSALYTCALRLRKSFADLVGNHPVVRRRGGYELQVDPPSVDMHRFRALVRRGRGLSGSGDDEAAADVLERALAEWSGTALGGVESAWASCARRTLEREWLAVQVAAAELRMRLGQDMRVVPVLSALADAHPRDERIAGMLMVSLYRCGRQAEALELYTRTRGRLVDELGREPGRDLRQLHQRLIEEDRTLTRHDRGAFSGG